MIKSKVSVRFIAYSGFDKSVEKRIDDKISEMVSDKGYMIEDTSDYTLIDEHDREMKFSLTIESSAVLSDEEERYLDDQIAYIFFEEDECELVDISEYETI